ncbi:dynein light chain Tctex-type 5-B-like [Bacillus rossius redtenbacheri]|uniref:dynein light chain Tctex-type 5-B-like n=1 Tax=Bacillus rossius redtenbacheri TaxID=93214 RepID=UPI002FDE308E
MNTYRLEPKIPLVPDRVAAVLKEVLDQGLGEARYDPDSCGDLATALSAEIRSRVKELLFDRYKIVCCVTICQKNLQGVHSVMRGLWDVARDKLVVHHFENTHIVAVGCVVGVYLE